MGLGDNLRITAQEAEQDVRAFQRKNMGSRKLPRILPRILDLQKEKVHVFSISPWQHRVPMGSWGSFLIPACPEGEEYVEFLMYQPNGGKAPIPALMIQPYAKNEREFEYYEEDGREWAEKLLGNDTGILPSASLNRYGVFVAAGAKPTKAELDKAHNELNQKLTSLVLEARQWSTDPILRTGISVEVHHKAARILNLNNESWMLATDPRGKNKCPVCGFLSDEGVLKCGNCREHIFDRQRYAEYISQQDREVEAAKKGK